MTGELLVLWILTKASSPDRICARRQGKLKSRTVGCVCRGPEPAVVGFDDRTADRQAHTHAVGFGGEKSGEQPIRVLGGKTDAAIRHADTHFLRLVRNGSYHQFARPML